MSGRTLLLTGVPRGGTTLACRLLGQAPETVALFEPMDVLSLPAEPEAALAAIAAFAEQARARLLREGVAPSKVHAGQVPDNPFGEPDPHSGQRRAQAHPGLLRLPAPPAPGFTLAIKHNAAFTALLPALARRFEVLAVVRHPLPVLASWQTVPLPVAEGRLPAGERLDAALAERLAGLPERLERQLAILDWCYARYAQTLPPERVLRYEDIVESGGARLYRAAGLSAPAQPLRARNANPLYRTAPLQTLAAALAARPGAYRHWYRPQEIGAMLARMRSPDQEE